MKMLHLRKALTLLQSGPHQGCALSRGSLASQSWLYSTSSESERQTSNANASTSSNSTIPAETPKPTSAASRRLLDIFEQAPVATGPDGAAAVPQARQPADQDQPAIPEHFKPEKNALSLVLQAVENCKPLMKVMTQKAGTRQIHIPRVVGPAEQRSMAVRWILEAAHKRREAQPAGKRMPMAECVAIELMLASRKKGAAREKRDALHALAIENKANLLRASG